MAIRKPTRARGAGASQRWRFGGPGRSPVRLDQIRGTVAITMDLAWPAIVWNDGRCWSLLHDLSPSALAKVMESLRKTELDRSAPHGALQW